MALEDLESVNVVAVAKDANECRALVRDLNLEMILLDMTPGNGVEVLRELAADVKVVALGVQEAESEVIACAEAGVSAYVTREESLSDLVATVEAAAAGDARCSARTAGMLLRRVTALAATRNDFDERGGQHIHLTSRELNVLDLLNEGLSNKQIARRLCIELPTVKNHVHHILEKLDVSRRAEAVAWARRHSALDQRARSSATRDNAAA